MTKQELLDNKYFRQMPPDTKIMLKTYQGSRELSFDDMTYERKIEGYVQRFLGADPIYGEYLTIIVDEKSPCEQHISWGECGIK